MGSSWIPDLSNMTISQWKFICYAHSLKPDNCLNRGWDIIAYIINLKKKLLYVSIYYNFCKQKQKRSLDIFNLNILIFISERSYFEILLINVLLLLRMSYFYYFCCMCLDFYSISSILNNVCFSFNAYLLWLRIRF